MFDISNLYEEAITNLKNWRGRYTKTEYPEKVVVNIFYRKVTMEILFGAILNSFETETGSNHRFQWNTWDIGFKFLKDAYSDTAVEKTQKILPVILKDRPNVFLGNVKFETFKPQIIKASLGDAVMLEDIEFAYVYYFLTDQAILLWSALGGTGLSKIDAISKLSGVVINLMNIDTYAQIENILGKVFVAPFLNEKYKSLPPN